MGEVPSDLMYDAVPFDAHQNQQQPMAWNRYPQGQPLVYADQLGRGGATQLRYAQTPQGSSAMMGDDDTGSGQLWQRQLGQIPGVGEAVCPPGTSFDFNTLKCEPGGLDPVIPGGPPPGGPPGQIPPGLPLVTEEQCKAREAAAFNRGVQEERAKIVTTAVITSVVSGLVGVGIGYVFGR